VRRVDQEISTFVFRYRLVHVAHFAYEICKRDGRGWRSGALVEQREMKQWVFKISKYSQELLDALDTPDRWPDKVRLIQRNWIGRSEGMLVRFALDPKTLPGARLARPHLAQASRQAENSRASDSLIHDSNYLILAGANERESTCALARRAIFWAL
jgi:hypothetical protein